MKLFSTIYATILFVVFTPGLLFTISKKMPKIQLALIHAILFGIIYHITRQLLWDSMAIYEPVQDMTQNANATTKLTIRAEYTPDPDSINPNGPPFATLCNATTIGQNNSDNNICQKVGNNYKWVTPCNANNVGAKNSNGQVCVNQGNGQYNWVG